MTLEVMGDSALNPHVSALPHVTNLDKKHLLQQSINCNQPEANGGYTNTSPSRIYRYTSRLDTKSTQVNLKISYLPCFQVFKVFSFKFVVLEGDVQP